MKSILIIVVLALAGCQATPTAPAIPTPPPHDLGPISTTEASPELRQAVATRGFQEAMAADEGPWKVHLLETAMSGDTPLAQRFQHRIDEVRPEWMEFVKSNCADPVIDSLATPATAKIAATPRFIFASYDRTSDVTTLDALCGKVDAQNMFGAMLRLDFYVTWSKSGPPDINGPWQVKYVFVAAPLSQ
jgi:hypothetical protein